MRCILTGLTRTLLPRNFQSYCYQSHNHLAHVCQNNWGLFIDLIASRDFAGLFMGTLVPFCHTKAASMRRNTTCYSKEPQLHADLIPLSRDQLDEGGTTMLPQLPFYKHLDNKTCTCSLDQSFRSTSLCMQPLKKIVL